MATIRPVLDKATKQPTGRWFAQINLGRYPETKQHRFVSKRFPTQKAAKAWATALEGDRNDGLYRATTTKQTLAAYLRESWLPHYATQVRSIYNIEKTIGKWILTPRPETPFLGSIPLRDLTVGDFKNLYRAMTAQGLRPRAVAHLHGLVKRALKAAVLEGMLPRNPAEGATPPKATAQAEITCEADEDAPWSI